MFVKVCCIADFDEARLAISAGASAIGLVSAMPSGPGPISENEIARIAVKELGGTGRVHDWTHSRRIAETVHIPVLLAGGLNPGNVRAAIERVRPAGVDVCSGLRSSGRLDAGKLQSFIDAIH